MHRDTVRSVGLHLFQELSTLGQQLAHTLLFRHGLGGVKPMFPASASRPRQPFYSARSSTRAAVHTAERDEPVKPLSFLGLGFCSQE